MSNNKQSSIEQFAIALYENGFLQGNGDEINDLLVYFKAMHKGEIIWAHGIKMKGVNNLQCVSGEQYYNERYGNDKQ